MNAAPRILGDVPRHWVGDGFFVKTMFSYSDLGHDLSPFLLFDYAAPREFPPRDVPAGVGEHPHRGFETVTIAYQGSVAHRDSSGSSGVIHPGDVQWMTAGSGVVHEEFHEREFAKRGGIVEMVQLWVNLPARDKKAAPRYQTLRAATIPTVALAAGVEARVIAGELSGAHGPAQTFTPVDLWDLTFAAGSSATLPRVKGHTAAVFVRHGSLRVGDDVTIGAGELVVLERDGERVELAAEAGTAALFLGGEPIREPIVGYGPFVMNTKAEIAAAFDDYEHGRMGRLAR